MDKPSKTFSRAGFYLILIFTFFAPISTTIAQIAAILAFALWIGEQLIFRNTDWVYEDMFLPVAGFIVFTLLAFVVSRLNASGASYAYTGYLAIFYFVVERFVSFSEKRKMIIWTFIAGVLISSAIDAIMSFSRAGLERSLVDLPSEKMSFFVLAAFSMILAFYAEGKGLSEKLFFGMVGLPLIAISFILFDIYVILIFLFIVLVVGIFKDRAALIPFAVFSILIFSGMFGIESGYSLSEAYSVFRSAFANFVQNSGVIEKISFFGTTDAIDISRVEARTHSFFLRLLATSGPPAFLLFLWILIRQFKGDLVKIRKTAYVEMKSFRLGIALTILSFVLLSLFESIFQSASAILVFWTILGMSET